MRPIILTFLNYYQPGYKAGGPMQSVANLVSNLGDEFDFRIVTSDRDFGDDVRYAGIEPGVWTPQGKATVCYLPRERMTLQNVSRLLSTTPHDAIYLNSFFDPRYTGLPLLARALRLAPKRPVVLAPRGEFSRGALALKSVKKRLYIALCKVLHLYSGLHWQASSDFEVDDIRRVMGPIADVIHIGIPLPFNVHRMSNRKETPLSIHVASDLPRAKDAAGDSLALRCDPVHRLRIVFLSRICEMKNLRYALEVLAQMTVPVEFDIYGPLEDAGYWQSCQAIIRSLPPHVQARYCGALLPPQVVATLRKYDVLFFPTLGENYGHVIVEAFQAGVPVLISDRTPWRNLSARGIGCDLPLADPARFLTFLHEMAGLSPEALREMRLRALAYGASLTENSVVVQNNRVLFLTALQQTSPLSTFAHLAEDRRAAS